MDGSRPGGAAGHRRKPTAAERRDEHARVEDPAVVLAAAVRFLETRARSEQEVRRRLTGAGYRPALVDGAVARLVELGVLDDPEFARGWVASRDRSRPRATRVLRAELARKGIEAATVDEVLTERAVADDSAAHPGDQGRQPRPGVQRAGPDELAARRLLERHAAALRRVQDPRKRWQRAYALLARNGFDPDLSGRLVREASRGWAAATDGPTVEDADDMGPTEP